jgi:sialate O-acetylesterase
MNVKSVKLRFTLCLLLALSSAVARAKLKLALVFTDDMILQRETVMPVWGWAEPGEKVVVEFAGQSETGNADAAGKWLVKLKPLVASANPATLTVRAEKSGQLVLTNVLVGEVWLAGGQSNMGIPLSAAPYARTEAAGANHLDFRYRVVTTGGADEPQRDLPVAQHPEKQVHPNHWQVCTPETAPGFSGVCYFFGLELKQELGIPVGILRSSVGGTPIEAWMSAQALQSSPAGRDCLAEWAAKRADPAKDRADYDEEVRLEREEAQAAKRPATEILKYQDPVKSNRRPSNLYNAMIAPIAPFPFRGVIWYQGESNSRPMKRALAYRKLFAGLIADWRGLWGKDFPFLFVQLPGYHGTNRVDWPAVREAQAAALTLPQTGMAVAIDVGSAKTIHPPDKKPVGHRLALQALKLAYGRQIMADSPMFSGVQFKKSRATVDFKNAPGGLVSKPDGTPAGFAVAGVDQHFVAAQAKIEGNDVVVWNDAVPNPVAVRYAFLNDTEAGLFSHEGLPAAPFRTDDWPLTEPPGK